MLRDIILSRYGRVHSLYDSLVDARSIEEVQERRLHMRRKNVLAAALAGAFGVTITAALANPLLGPVTAPMVGKAAIVPVQTVPVQTKLLNVYREVRSFWLSRGIVR